MKFHLILMYLSILGCVCERKSYRASFDSFEFCKDVNLPFANPLPYDLQLELYNSTKGYGLIRGNVTFNKELNARLYKGTFAAGLKTSSGIKWFLKIKDFNCNSFVIKSILGGFGVPIKGYVIKKGVYIMKEVDADSIENAFFATGAPSRVLGSYAVRVVLYSKTATISCWELGLVLSPLPKPRGQ